MAINATTGASRPGIIPPQVVRIAFHPVNRNNEHPLQRRPEDRPMSRNNIRPPRRTLQGDRINFVF
ncbi:MAG: hypothetical protein JXA52_06035 [Planctomycetes bacterium]|nr:hypothetical protein [Planctomycetota bacterium]